MMPKLVLNLTSLVYGLVGVAFFTAPVRMAALVDVVLSNATADNDARAVYGGVSLGLAAFFRAAALRPAWFRPALFAQTFTLGGMAGARIVSWAVVGFPGPIGFALHAAEVAALVAGIVALRRCPPNDAVE